MFVKVDAAQIEWRTALESSLDPVGIAEILNNEDVHANNQIAFSLPERLVAKRFLFRTIFRGSGWAFANDPDFMHVSTDPAYWDGQNEKFYKKYKGLDACHFKWAELVKQGKPIVGPLGRSWSIPMKEGFKIPWTTLANYPVQGLAADVMMFVRISAYKRIKAAGYPCKWVATVHDDIKVDVPSEHVQQTTDIFHSCFDDLPKNIYKVFGYEWTVPMSCEAKAGMNLKNMTLVERSA